MSATAENHANDGQSDGSTYDVMKKKIGFILFLFLFSRSSAQEVPTKNLTFEKFTRIHGDYQPSGSILRNGLFYFVSDTDQDNYIYSLNISNGTVSLALDLHQVQGYDPYIKRIGQENRHIKRFRPKDYEGLGFCENPLTYYIANERVRNIMIIEQNVRKQFDLITFSIDDGDIYLGDINAGFEGVAVDCENKVMYVAKERDPRFIYKVDMKQIQNGKKIKASDKFDIPTATKYKSQDVSDLFFDHHQLYILERNAHAICVYDPDQKKVVDRYSYESMRDHEFDDNHNGKIEADEEGLFATGEPFGLAEGLVIDHNQVYLFYDNNREPLSAWASQKFSLEKNNDSLMSQFSIPK